MKTQIFDIPNTGAKAKNHVSDTKNTLFSYNTKVAEFDTKTREMQVYGYYSPTTGRHINEFFKIFGIPTQTKSELIKNYHLTK
tara:strand:+ start:17271 stop:17519 length:249 start_codon:yes stop_codon:yes gene_type:complete